jgi:hypothetical protein
VQSQTAKDTIIRIHVELSRFAWVDNNEKRTMKDPQNIMPKMKSVTDICDRTALAKVKYPTPATADSSASISPR